MKQKWAIWTEGKTAKHYFHSHSELHMLTFIIFCLIPFHLVISNLLTSLLIIKFIKSMCRCFMIHTCCLNLCFDIAFQSWWSTSKCFVKFWEKTTKSFLLTSKTCNQERLSGYVPGVPISPQSNKVIYHGALMVP